MTQELQVVTGKTIGELARIAERSAGYSIIVVEGGMNYNLTDLRFVVRSNGRRNRGLVECLSNGERALFNSDEMMELQLG